MSGLIHEKLDIKILILYVLRRLSVPVDQGSLFDICQCDSGVSYFDWAECLNDLIDTGHITQDDDCCIITEKGLRNAEAVDGSLPYSVRKSADRSIAAAAERLDRAAMIIAESIPTQDGLMVHLSLGDGVGKLIDMNLACADENQAKKIKRNFRHNAEKIYKEIIEALT